MGLAAVLVYWLFMGGSSSGPAPPPSDYPNFDVDDEVFCGEFTRNHAIYDRTSFF